MQLRYSMLFHFSLSANAVKAELSVTETVLNEILKTVECICLIRTVCYERYSHILNNAERKYTEKALCINAAIVLLYVNRALIGISLLDKEGSRASMQTDAVYNRYIA